MADDRAPVWPRPYFKAGELQTKIAFVCFGRAPLGEVELGLSRFGLPSAELAREVQMREHQRKSAAAYFQGWWSGSFGVIAARDLEGELALLTTSDVCFSLTFDGPDRADLAPAQTVWGLSRWLCTRGINVVLDIHAMRFRSRAEVEALDFAESDATRDVKIVLETDATRHGLHLMHTRGLCKFARPELMCFIEPSDAAVMGRAMNQIARTLMEGAVAEQIRLKVAGGIELRAAPGDEQALIKNLGLETAVTLRRSDGSAIAGVARGSGRA
jgi:hypothetical protein